jgi:hypothetical protein
MNANGPLPLSQDAALVAALAGTAMPFSHSAADQAERWLRVLRLHGQVGAAMQALGVSEAPLMTGSDPMPDASGGPPLGDEVVERVVRRADELATERQTGCVCTLDVLFALFEIYGGLIDRALYIRGSSRAELIEQLPGGRVEASC